MKLLIYVLVIAAVVEGAALTSEAKLKPVSQRVVSQRARNSRKLKGLLLTAFLERVVVDSGEAVAIRLTLKNIASESLFIYETGKETDYRIIVKDKKGDLVPLTEYGKQVMDTAGEFRRIKVEVKPQQEERDILPVGQIYEMKASGIYSITVTRPFFEKGGKSSEAISNTVKVKVIR